MIKNKQNETLLRAASGLLVFIGMAQFTLLAADESGPSDYEAMQERIANSPELSELDESYWAQGLEWNFGLWCHLMQSDNPEVRVLAAEMSISGQATECRVAGEPLSPAEVREQALLETTDVPALLLRRYWKERRSNYEAFNCNDDELSQRLLALEPDNAYYHLLPVPDDYSAEQEMPCDAREWILAAAAVDDFNMHYSSGLHAAYLEIASYVQKHPPPLPGKPLREVWDEFGNSPVITDQAIEPSLDLIVQQPLPDRTVISIRQRCRQALSESDATLIEACLALADTMMGSGHTGWTYMTGAALRRTMLYPESQEEGQATDPNRQRQLSWRDAMIFECQMPKQLWNRDADISLPPDYHLTHLQDYANLGEWAAYRNTAAREYAIDPSLFALDPSRCEDIRQLNEAQQQELVILWQKKSDDHPRGWLALQAAREMLDTQEAKP